MAWISVLCLSAFAVILGIAILFDIRAAVGAIVSRDDWQA